MATITAVIIGEEPTHSVPPEVIPVRYKSGDIIDLIDTAKHCVFNDPYWNHAGANVKPRFKYVHITEIPAIIDLSALRIKLTEQMPQIGSPSKLGRVRRFAIDISLLPEQNKIDLNFGETTISWTDVRSGLVVKNIVNDLDSSQDLRVQATDQDLG